MANHSTSSEGVPFTSKGREENRKHREVFEKLDLPMPGSNEALDKGCTCPVLDNGRGRIDWRGFWINETCPLHVVPA